MDVSINQILKVLKKYWNDKDGTAGYDVARKVVSLITDGMPEYKSGTTYKTIFKDGPSHKATSKILNHLADASKFIDYMEKNISEGGRSNLAKELKNLTGVKMDRGTVGRTCYNLLVNSLKASDQQKDNKNKKSPTKSETRNFFNKTVSDEEFSTVFSQVNVSNMSAVKNDNSIHAYILKPELIPFRYEDLRGLVISNITNYAIARGVKRADIAGIEATILLRKYVKSGIPDNLLGELLTYIFLEHEEDAQKLYSRAEISSSRTIDSEGVYLKYSGEKTQLILGASQLSNDLQDAIDDVVNELANYVNNKSSELMLATDMVDNTILQSQFGEEESRDIIELLTPSENSVDYIASYGLFIGYNFKTDLDLYNCDVSVAKTKCRQAINNDLQQAIEKLNEAIQIHHWQKSSFYVYLLPFTNAEEDSSKIMNDLIGE